MTGSIRNRLLRRSRLLGLIGGGVIVLLILGAAVAFADGGTLDVQVADKTGYAVDTTTNGGIVEYIGDSNISFGSSGTGTFGTFVQIHDTPSEQGYNTDGTREFDTGSSPTFNHSILLSDIPVVPCASLDGSKTTSGLCWELFADINDSNANDPTAAHIQLTDLEVWLTGDHNITGFDQGGTGFGAAADKVYDFAGNVLINDVNQGSGRGDLRYLIPVTGIDLNTLAPNCGFKNPACATYFVLYSAWGDPANGTYRSDSGFEEWKVKTYPYVTVTKTATTSFTRTFPWSIDKSVTPATWNLFTGESGTSQYTVALTKGAGVDSGWAVSGNITISNPGTLDAKINSLSDITDSISGVGNATVVCSGASFPVVLSKNDSLACTYTRSLPDGTNRTNTATVTLAEGTVFQGTAAVTFGAPTTVVNDTVHVTDTYSGGPQNQAFSASGSVNYNRTFTCDADEGKHDNTATIVETQQSDSASVTVNCYDIAVTKTASTALTRTWNWTIDKSVTPATWNLFTGDSGTSDYTIQLTKTGSTDSGWAVTGNITVSNVGNPIAATINSVSDLISGFGGTVTVDCGSAVFPYTIAAGGTLGCTYSATLPDGTTRTNTATAVQQLHTYDKDGTPTNDGTSNHDGTASVDFSAATVTDVNPSVHVTDTYAGGPQNQLYSGSATITYSRTFTCDGDEGKHDNTATIVETQQSDSASVTVNCYEVTVTKTANTSFTRTYGWSIDKSADQTELTLMPDETFLVHYSVSVNTTGSTDSDWAVAGSITVHNPAPIAATINSVSDVMSVDGTVTVDCSPATFPYTLAAGGDLVCTYSKSTSAATNQTNTATATRQNYDYDSSGAGTASGTTDISGSHGVTFSSTPSSVVDECITVTDTNVVDPLGTACIGDTLPKTFTYSLTVGGYPADQCGDHTVDNTATFTTNDLDLTGESSWSVLIHVLCPPPGCTLTQGYWKTHSFYGPAPFDDAWDLLLPNGQDTTFYLSGQTWYEVFWTAPKKGNAYYILAHQYEAAILNQLNGAGSTSAVDAALAFADSFFSSHTPSDNLSKSLRQQVIAAAGVLGSYNQGLTGPGHCSEDSPSLAANTDSATTTLNQVFFPFLLPFAAPMFGFLRRRLRI